jgi:hypothetical protein
MADNDIEGQFATLLHLLNSDTWRELWQSLNLVVETFESLELERRAPDVLVWTTCQDREVILITGNRNHDGPDSLEATLRARNEAGCLPVFTLADPDSITQGGGQASLVAERLLGYLLEIDRYRGAGRLWLP